LQQHWLKALVDQANMTDCGGARLSGKTCRARPFSGQAGIRPASGCAMSRRVGVVCYLPIGIGEYHDYPEGLTTELDVSEDVHRPGHVSPEDLTRWYNACDIFVMPNQGINGDTEGCGTVYMKAAARGKQASHFW
jgi:hypothetical protein